MKNTATTLLILTVMVSLMVCGAQGICADSAKADIQPADAFALAIAAQQEEAYARAVAALQEEFGEDALGDERIWDRVDACLVVNDSGKTQWHFTLFSKKADSIFESFPYYDVWIDSETGETVRTGVNTEMIEADDVDLADWIAANEYDMLDIADMIQADLIGIASLSYMLEENIIDMDDIAFMVKANAVDIGDLFEAGVIDLDDISYMIEKRASDMLDVHELIKAGVIDLDEYADIIGVDARDIADMIDND